MDETVVLTLEGSMTYTFTDYLDDASTIYIAYPELLEKAGPLTAALANRQGEYLGTGPVITPTGSAGQTRHPRFLRDGYLARIDVFDVGADRYKVRQHNHKKMRCPRF